jgi:hypothetical protein
MTEIIDACCCARLSCVLVMLSTCVVCHAVPARDRSDRFALCHAVSCMQVMATIVRGVFLCLKHQIPLMLETAEGKGAIVITSSTAGGYLWVGLGRALLLPLLLVVLVLRRRLQSLVSTLCGYSHCTMTAVLTHCLKHLSLLSSGRTACAGRCCCCCAPHPLFLPPQDWVRQGPPPLCLFVVRGLHPP